MTAAGRRRGQPLAVLAAVLGGWVLVRALLWEPASPPFAARELVMAEAAAPQAVPSTPRVLADLAHADAPQGAAFAFAPLPKGPCATNDCRPHAAAIGWTNAVMVPPRPAVKASALVPAAGPVLPREPMLVPRVAAGHQLLRLAALGQLPLPPSFAAAAALPSAVPQMRRETPDATPRPSRWSGDGWVLLRRGSDGLVTAPSFARYGASQAGAVLRYAIAPASPLRPQAHLRLTRALVLNGESEAALGVSLRAPRGVPVRLYGEGRVQRVGGETRVRPAAMLVSEVPPIVLPLGAQAEAYAATGYVGGRDATPFFDAQITADRAVIARGLSESRAELRLGAGAWAGGQEGAARLDIGPRASLRLKIGEVPSRLALDWRFRVAGRAAPASGPALTLSAGF